MTSKEAIEIIRNGGFITCKVCNNQWNTGCMCCRVSLSKSKELDIIEKDLAILDYIKENIKNGAILIPSELVEDNEDFKEWLENGSIDNKPN